MTGISVTSQNFAFNKNMFSDPAMQPYLETYYNDKYDAIRESLSKRQAAQDNGEFPNSIQTQDGKTLTPISASKMIEAIPSFDKWLDVQQNVVSSFDFIDQTGSMLEQAREHVTRLQTDFNPNQPSGVQTIFADGDRILGYINQDGGVVTHNGGSFIQDIVQQADALHLTGTMKDIYISEAFHERYANIDIYNYTAMSMPTHREFAEKWYPNHDVDASYQTNLQEAMANLKQQEDLYTKQMENLNDFRQAMIDIMQEAQASER